MSLADLRETNSHARRGQTDLREAILIARRGQASGYHGLNVITNVTFLTYEDYL